MNAAQLVILHKKVLFFDKINPDTEETQNRRLQTELIH